MDEALRLFMKAAETRHLDAWLSLLEGKTLAETRALLPEPRSVRWISKAIRTALGGRERFLRAQFTPEALPSILAALGREDDELGRLAAELAVARSAEARASEELRRVTISLTSLLPG